MNNVVSPTRRYVVVTRDIIEPNRDHVSEITVSELYPNDIEGARNYYLDRVSSIAKISRCVPREYYLAELREKEKKQIKFNYGPSVDEIKEKEREISSYEDWEGNISTTYTLTPHGMRILLDRIKTLLRNFYFLDHELEDSEILEVLDRMMDDIRRYEGLYSRIQHDMKILKDIEGVKIMDQTESSVSPTRKYVLIVTDIFDNASEHVYKITLPEDLENNTESAMQFFSITVDSKVVIGNCLPYEVLAEKKEVLALLKTLEEEDLRYATILDVFKRALRNADEPSQ